MPTGLFGARARCVNALAERQKGPLVEFDPAPAMGCLDDGNIARMHCAQQSRYAASRCVGEGRSPRRRLKQATSSVPLAVEPEQEACYPLCSGPWPSSLFLPSGQPERLGMGAFR